MDFHHKNNEGNTKSQYDRGHYEGYDKNIERSNEKVKERNQERNQERNEKNNDRNDKYNNNKNDRKRRERHQKRKNKKYSSSSQSRPSSSVSVSVSQSESSSSSEKQPRYRPKNHDNMVLLVENLPEDLNKQQLDSAFNEAAMEANVIPHEEISIINAFGQAYIKYCTVDYARKVLIYLKGKIQIGEHQLNVDFYDDTSGRQRRNRHELKNSLINQPPTSYDWICDKCGYENFAKRHKCNKCLNPRNINCKILSVMMAPPTGFADDSICNTSLMIKAKSIADATDSDILDIFSPLAAVKDIRLVKNKVPKDPRMKEQKDFAFVEFFSVEDAENVYRYVTQNEVRLNGDQLIIQYSRNNRGSRFDDHKPFGFYPNNQFVMHQQNTHQQSMQQQQNQTQQNQQPQEIIQQQQQSQQIPINMPQQIPVHQIPSLPQNQQQQLPIPQIPLPMPDVQIVQPIVQAPYQTAQLAQERIIVKQEQKLTLSTPQMNLMSQLPPKIHTPKPPQQQQQQLNNQQQQKKKQKQEEIDEDIKSDKEEDQPSPVLPKVPNKPQPQLTEAQIRKKAELDLKKWEKQQQIKKPEIKVAPSKPIINQVEVQARLILYICPICRKKFPNEEIMNYHSLNSDLHKQKLLAL